MTGCGGPGPLRYRVWIDDGCIGSGQCEMIDSERFAIGDEGLAEVIGESEVTIDDDPATRADGTRQLAYAPHRGEQLPGRRHPRRRAPMIAYERRSIGSTAVTVTDLRSARDRSAVGRRRSASRTPGRRSSRPGRLGIRHFDTAPLLYGYGQAETWLGRALAGLPRREFTVSTKVGRLLRAPTPDSPPDYFHGTTSGLRPTWDFSADGVRRSFEESLGRLGVDDVEMLLVHDPDDHLDEALGEALPALVELRGAGCVSAIRGRDEPRRATRPPHRGR